MPGSFTLDVEKIRDRARQKMNQGPVTDTYGKKAGDVIEVLNEVLATKIVCWMRYSRHAIEHAEEEREHAVRIAERISQLGGEPDFDPATIARLSHTTYESFDDSDLDGMLRENLSVERIGISTYREVIRWLGDDDVTTRRLMEEILAEEEEHADDIIDLLRI